MTRRAIEFSFAPGSRFNQKKAQEYGKAILVLMRATGSVTSAAVVEAARERDSVLHDGFTWNVKSAAYQYNLSEARSLLNHLCVKVDGGPSVPIKAFFNVTVATEGDDIQQVYLDVEQVVLSEAATAQVIDAWKLRLKRIRAQLRLFEEFSEIVTAIDAVIMH